MPYKFEKQKWLLPRKLDSRRKLTPEEVLEIRELYGKISQRKLAKMFKVSRSTVVFIGDVEAKRRNLQRRAERGGWRQYYLKVKHRKCMSKYRLRKEKLFKEFQAIKDNGV